MCASAPAGCFYVSLLRLLSNCHLFPRPTLPALILLGISVLLFHCLSHSQSSHTHKHKYTQYSQVVSGCFEQRQQCPLCSGTVTSPYAVSHSIILLVAAMSGFHRISFILSWCFFCFHLVFRCILVSYGIILVDSCEDIAEILILSLTTPQSLSMT